MPKPDQSKPSAQTKAETPAATPQPAQPGVSSQGSAVSPASATEAPPPAGEKKPPGESTAGAGAEKTEPVETSKHVDLAPLLARLEALEKKSQEQDKVITEMQGKISGMEKSLDEILAAKVEDFLKALRKDIDQAMKKMNDGIADIQDVGIVAGGLLEIFRQTGHSAGAAEPMLKELVRLGEEFELKLKAKIEAKAEEDAE